MKNWQVIAICNLCKSTKIKRKSEYNEDSYLCQKCHRHKQGKLLGQKYGQNQTVKGKCKGCETLIKTDLKWCNSSECQLLKATTFKDRMTGNNSPVWTGKSICGCGKNKSAKATLCRSCSYNSGMRSGLNNGRYVSDNREQFLANKKSAKIARTMLDNYLKNNGLKKTLKSEKMLGYSFNEFKIHIESQFEPWMNWDNHGNFNSTNLTWQIDHIVPMSYLNAINITQPNAINALINLRPLASIDNLKKSNSLPTNYEIILTAIKEINNLPNQEVNQ